MKRTLLPLLVLAAALSARAASQLRDIPLTNTVYTAQEVDVALAVAAVSATNYTDAARAYAVAVSNTLDAALAGKAGLADVTLAPGPQFSAWTCVPAGDGTGNVFRVYWNTTYQAWMMAVREDGTAYWGPEDANATSFSMETTEGLSVSATRSPLPPSYVLGSQTNKLLATAADYATTNALAEEAAAATNYTDESVAAITVRTRGGYRDPDFWLPKVTAGAGTSRTIAISKAGQALGIDGDVSWRRAYNDGSEAYVLSAYVDPDRRVDSSEIEYVPGVWSIVSDSSGLCYISGNTLKGGGQDAVVVLRFTADDGTSKTLTVRVGAFSRNEMVLNAPYEEYDGTFRHAYATNILARFATLDWTTGHYFPNFLRVNRDRWLPCYFGREPWALELFSDYDSWVTTETKIWNNSTNFTWFTGGVHDSPRTKAAGLTYKNALVSMANGPREMNEDFFWPELQDKLRAVSGARADWYAEKTAIKLSKHYILTADHYNQNTHRFFLSDGSFTNVSSTASWTVDGEGRLLGGDWRLKLVPGGIPDDVPNMEFFGPHGTNALSSLYALSPSLLRGTPAIQVTQGNTVALGYVSTMAGGQAYTLDGLPPVTNSITYSHQLSFDTNVLHWVCTNYPALNAEHVYYNKRVIRWKNETEVNEKNHVFTIDDIDGFYDATEGSPSIFYVGEHYPIQGDSSRPLMGFYNDHLWLYGLYYSPSGGQSALDLFVTSRLDAFIRADSLARFGTEEGLTFCDCCDLDTNHQFHTHQ